MNNEDNKKNKNTIIENKLDRPFTICVIGYSGYGKSSFINEFIGKDVAEVRCGDECTKDFNGYDVPKDMFNMECKIIDTPKYPKYNYSEESKVEIRYIKYMIAAEKYDIYIIITDYRCQIEDILDMLKGNKVIIVIGYSDKIDVNQVDYMKNKYSIAITDEFKQNVMGPILIRNRCHLRCLSCNVDSLIQDKNSYWCVNVGQFEGHKRCPLNTNEEPTKFPIKDFDRFEHNVFNSDMCPKCYSISNRLYTHDCKGDTWFRIHDFAQWKCSNNTCPFYKDWKFAFEAYGHEDVRDVIRNMIKCKQ